MRSAGVRRVKLKWHLAPYPEIRPVQVSGGKGRDKVDWILIGRDWLDSEVGTALALLLHDPGKEMRGGAVELFRCPSDDPRELGNKGQFGLRTGGCLGMEKRTGLAKLIVVIIVIASFLLGLFIFLLSGLSI